MLPWFNHQATIIFEKRNSEMSAEHFVWWCSRAFGRLQSTWFFGEPVIRHKRLRIHYEYKFDPLDDSVKSFNITITRLTKESAFAICCVASMFNEMKVTTFYQ